MQGSLLIGLNPTDFRYSVRVLYYSRGACLRLYTAFSNRQINVKSISLNPFSCYTYIKCFRMKLFRKAVIILTQQAFRLCTAINTSRILHAVKVTTTVYIWLQSMLATQWLLYITHYALYRITSLDALYLRLNINFNGSTYTPFSLLTNWYILAFWC